MKGLHPHMKLVCFSHQAWYLVIHMELYFQESLDAQQKLNQIHLQIVRMCFEMEKKFISYHKETVLFCALYHRVHEQNTED